MERGEGRWSKGVIFFIIMTLAQEAPIYGNQVANIIYERTNGAWKPSPGSVYPALERLTRRELIERYNENGKVMYKITGKGLEFVKKIGERHMNSSPMLKFMGKMWMDALGPEDKAKFILNSVQNMVTSLEVNLENIHNGFGNEKQFRLFLMSFEVELEKALRIISDAKEKSTEKEEVK